MLPNKPSFRSFRLTGFLAHILIAPCLFHRPDNHGTIGVLGEQRSTSFDQPDAACIHRSLKIGAPLLIKRFLTVEIPATIRRDDEAPHVSRHLFRSPLSIKAPPAL